MSDTEETQSANDKALEQIENDIAIEHYGIYYFMLTDSQKTTLTRNIAMQFGIECVKEILKSTQSV